VSGKETPSLVRFPKALPIVLIVLKRLTSTQIQITPKLFAVILQVGIAILQVGIGMKQVQRHDKGQTIGMKVQRLQSLPGAR
jgi:hypothetical protein